MTDNEQRAHDLAMLYVAEQMKHNHYSVVMTEHYDDSTNADYVDNYVDLYSSILDHLEQNPM